MEPVSEPRAPHGGRIELVDLRKEFGAVAAGATTQVHVRLPGGGAIQALTANHDGRPDWPAGTPVGVTLPADALRALPA
jgi:hypothetical protein